MSSTYLHHRVVVRQLPSSFPESPKPEQQSGDGSRVLQSRPGNFCRVDHARRHQVFELTRLSIQSKGLSLVGLDFPDRDSLFTTIEELLPPSSDGKWTIVSVRWLRHP